MLSLHRKKRVITAVITTAAIMPMVIFAVFKTLNFNNTFASSYVFENQYFYGCLEQSFRNDYPDESIMWGGLSDEQLLRVKHADCDYTRMGYTIHYSNLVINDIDNDLEKVPNLETLTITGWETLTHIDLSHNTHLKSLNLSGEPLTSINLAANTSLETVNLSDIGLTGITLPTTGTLTTLDVSNNNLSSLNVSGLTGLQTLKVQENSIETLDLRNNTALSDLMADVIMIDANMSYSYTNNNHVFDLSGAQFIGHNNTLYAGTGYAFNNYTHTLTVNDLAQAPVAISTTSSYDYYGYNIKLPIVSLRFEVGSGSGNVPKQACALVSGSCTVTIPDVEPTYANHIFRGWANVSNATTPNYEIGDTVTLTANKSVYAVWESTVTYSLTFDKKGGSGTIENESCETTTTIGTCDVTIPDTEPTKTNYNFLGWSDSGTATSASYHAGDTIHLTENKRIYAVWEWVRPTFTLDYGLMGGSGTIETQSCVAETSAGCSVTIPTTMPNKDEYDFGGWADSYGSSYIKYHGGDQLVLTRDTTIYAVWVEPATLTLIYNKNGGNGSITNGTCVMYQVVGSCDVTITDAEPNRSGYRFLGWANDSGATSPDYLASGTVTLTQNKTIYAVWEKIITTLTLDFNLNGAAGTVGSVSCNADIDNPSCAVAIPNTTPERNGYNFLGWAESDSATEAGYAAGGSVTLSGDKTLYAVWELIQNTLTLDFNLNGAEGAVESTTCIVDVLHPTCTASIPNVVPERNGYNFLGWAGSDAATEAGYVAGGSVTLSGNMTLYAVWEWIPPVYTLSFNVGEGSGTVSAQSCSPSEVGGSCSVQIPEANIALNGHRFLGWANASNATEVNYTASSTLSLSGNKTVYAVYEQIVSYAVSFAGVEKGRCEVAHGETSCEVAFDPVTIELGETEVGLGFSEDQNAETGSEPWTTRPDGKWVLTLNVNKNFYAIVTKKHEVGFRLNGGTAEGLTRQECTPETARGNCTITIPNITPVYEGYEFLGYSNHQPGDTLTFGYNDPVSTTLYADWGGGELTWIQGQEREKGDKIDIKLRATYPSGDFSSLKIDGAVVSADKYTVESGSTIITIDDEYLDGLDVGEHSLRLNYEHANRDLDDWTARFDTGSGTGLGDTEWLYLDTTFTLVAPQVIPDEQAMIDEDEKEDDSIVVPNTGVGSVIDGGSISRIACIISGICLAFVGKMIIVRIKK